MDGKLQFPIRNYMRNKELILYYRKQNFFGVILRVMSSARRIKTFIIAALYKV